MTKCEKCYCEFEETEMVIAPQQPKEQLSFICKECYAIKEKSCNTDKDNL